MYVKEVSSSGVVSSGFWALESVSLSAPGRIYLGRVYSILRDVMEHLGCGAMRLEYALLSRVYIPSLRALDFAYILPEATYNSSGVYFRSASFDQGRLVLGGSKQSSNYIIGSRPVVKGNILDFDTLKIMSAPDPSKPVDAEGFRHPFTPESGLNILWMKRLREYFYVGTTLGLVKVTKLTASSLADSKINRSVVVDTLPTSVFNQLLFSTKQRNKVYTLEYSRDVNRETIFTVSDSVFTDLLSGDKVYEIVSSPSENFFLITFQKNKDVVVHGQLIGSKSSFSLLSFGGPTDIGGVIDSTVYFNVVGTGFLECNLADFSQPIEDSAVVGLDLLSPSVLSYSDKQNVTEDRLSNTVFAGKLVGDFNGPVDITSEHMEKTGQLPFKSVDPHEVSFSDVPRGDIFDSVKFKFKGRKVTVLAAKYGVRT